MTSRQYYEQTSKMAYPLDDIMYDEAENNKIIANIALTHGEPRKTAGWILTNNDFFSISEDAFSHFDTDSELELEIRFHYGIDDVDCYRIDVCDIINCTCVEGGRVVLSCEGYELANRIRPACPSANVDVKKQDDKVAKNDAPRSIFDLFDDLVGCSSCLNDLFNFPAFPKMPDITKMVEGTKKDIEKGDGNAKFYNFSCKIDPDGNVHIKRSSNDGTVEKNFKLGDTKGVKDEKQLGNDCNKEQNDPKTELRNLVKNDSTRF